MEIPIDLARRVQRRPVISVLRPPSIDAGEGKIYVERTLAAGRIHVRFYARQGRFCRAKRFSKCMRKNCIIFSWTFFTVILPFFKVSSTRRANLSLSRTDIQEARSNLYSCRNYASHPRSVRARAHRYSILQTIGEFSISSVSSAPVAVNSFLIAHIKLPRPAFQLSRRVCPTAALYLRKFIQRCILPAVLHLSRCNAIPSKINETRCRCFFSMGERG